LIVILLRFAGYEGSLTPHGRDHTGVDAINEPVGHLNVEVGAIRPRTLSPVIHLPPEHLVIGNVLGIELSALLYPITV
jgi:hypothetical protein